jgi:hypothetical protein
VHWTRAGRVALVTLAGTLNSLLGVLERARYSRTIARTRLEHAPVFILGHWRSGTTLLHNLMARDPQFLAPTHYQVSFPGHFLVTERWFPRLLSGLLPTTRPMDNVALAWDVPGEDEIALLLLTLCSPYLVAAFPDAPESVERFANLRSGLSEAELERWKRCFVLFLTKVSLRDPRPLLLKSPTHTGRIPLLLELFPHARFIYVVRNPYDVYSSTLHLHRVLSRQNGFSCSPPARLEERVMETYVELYQAYHLQRALIPVERRYELRFEDLAGDPVNELQKLYAHFGFDGGDALPALLREELQQHAGYRPNVYSMTSDERRRVSEQWGAALRRYGYESGDGRVECGERTV